MGIPTGNCTLTTLNCLPSDKKKWEDTSILCKTRMKTTSSIWKTIRINGISIKNGAVDAQSTSSM